MISKFYIIKESGVLVSYINFNQIETESKERDPELTSGFIAAIIAFFNQENEEKVPGEERKICKLLWKKHDLYFYGYSDYYFVFEVIHDSVKFDTEEWNMIFDFVVKKFNEIEQQNKIRFDACLVCNLSEFETAIRGQISKMIRKKILLNAAVAMV
jgi:hypothetical protein